MSLFVHSLKQNTAIVLILATLLGSMVSGWAWSSPGHMTIAAIAYRDLSATAKAEVNALLQHHPDYNKWAAGYPSNAVFDLPTFIFMRASTWPDEIRRKGNGYDHPQWHYVNLPLVPPAFPEKPSPFPTNDIVFGIGQCEKIIKDKSQSQEMRAVYLSWLIHLVGDIHQPLHCVSFVTPEYPAPQGDKGGNDFFVRPNAAGVNLHSVWDKGLGSSVNARQQLNDAIEISVAHKRNGLSELSKYKTPTSWSVESRQIALESGYLKGTLKGSRTKTDAPPLPEGYTKNLKQIAEKQAAIAGYRLADEVRKVLR